MLRDGRVWRITWSKAHEGGADRLPGRTAASPWSLDPGQVWVVLKDRTRKVRVD